MSLKLSIIVPMYKSEWCIADCITSLYHQDLSLDEYEVIAVDNGSPDGCADYIRSLQKRYANLQLISLPINRLPSGARNVGMDAAQGTYLMFVDSDDMLKPNVLKHLIGEIAQDNLDFVHFGADELCGSELRERKSPSASLIMSGAELYFWKLMSKNGKETTWSKIYSRKFLIDNNIKCREGLLFEDTEFAFRLFAIAKRAKHIAYKPYIYRLNTQSATQNRITESAVISDLLEVPILIKDIRMFKANQYDSRFIPEMEGIIRYDIANSLKVYKFFRDNEKLRIYKTLQRCVSWRCLPYMSKKKFILLKLGII